LKALAIVMQEIDLSIGLACVSLSLFIWLGLLIGRGGFWRSDVVLERESGEHIGSRSPLTPLTKRGVPDKWFEVPLLKGDLGGASHVSVSQPFICAVIPARNEADLLPLTLKSLLIQTYPNAFQIILVDDHSTDGTAEVARKSEQLQIISAQPLPAGWSGKLWAMHQGVEAAKKLAPDYILLTDADILHDPDNLQRLVRLAISQNLDMASIMVRLRCESVWEKLLIPAFVFFFEKLYPFRWVNDPARQTAAAAGGCILIRQTALDRIGGIASIRQALIDDCALAQAVKGSGGDEEDGEARIWLGLSDYTHSLRPYPSLDTIWDMVTRTAFTQLNYSPLLLIGTVLGMGILYLAAPIGLLTGLGMRHWLLVSLSLLNWLMMTGAYYPTVRFYRCQMLAVSLPLIAFLYTLMTIDSAIRYWQGRGGAWKGRVYSS
jgi:hopene-associated glycosyltransferase HpnB